MDGTTLALTYIGVMVNQMLLTRRAKKFGVTVTAETVSISVSVLCYWLQVKHTERLAVEIYHNLVILCWTSELSFCRVSAMLWLHTSMKQFIRPKRLIVMVALTAVVTTMSRGCQSVHSRVLIEPGTDRASPEIRWSYSLLKDLVTPSWIIWLEIIYYVKII